MHLRYVTAGLVGLSLAAFASGAAGDPLVLEATSASAAAHAAASAVPIDTRDAFPGETGRAEPSVVAAPAAPAPAAAPAATVTTMAMAVDPVVLAVRARLADKALIGKASPANDVAALAAFYAARPDALWITSGAYNDRAKAVLAELQKAGDWGLEAADFAVSSLVPAAPPDAQAAAEVELSLAALRYARYARGGRLDPRALSNILDMAPPVLEPGAVFAGLAQSSAPDAYLSDLNPKHVGFERLRQELLRLRGASKGTAIDPALLVEIPAGKLLKPGAKDNQIALLRKRLKVPATTPEDERVFDEALVTAVRSFQTDNGLKVTGTLNNRTRTALNAAGHPGADHGKKEIDRLLANMERWRWLPADLGGFYVMNNIPEFVSEIWKGRELKLKQNIIVGQPSWPTPVLAASMQFVIFHPSWGMPDGIKRKELLPRLKRAAEGGNDFFEQLFGGGSRVAEVVKSYKLQVTMNGKPVDPDTIDWSTADIRRFEFVQPPGADNPLGQVKFRFPNPHNVYMHDTPQRGLFGNANRALSHGCMRLAEPRKTAEVILGEDKGWSVAKVDELYKGGSSITLDKPVPVYLVYFTARVDDAGRLHTYGDIYGNDGRVMQALRGHAVRYVAPQAVDPAEAAEQKAQEQPERKS